MTVGWPYTTPSGHTYEEPTDYASLCRKHTTAAQAVIETWDAVERPPEPTWEMVGLAHREVERWQRLALHALDDLRTLGVPIERITFVTPDVLAEVDTYGREMTAFS